MPVIGSFLKVQWRLTLDWPDFGFGGRHAAITSKRSPSGPRQLDYAQWIRILDDITATCERAGTGGRMHFYVSSRATEPDYFLTFLEEVHARGLGIRLLGRPTFIDETTVEVMARLGIRPFHLRFMPRDRHPSDDGAPELEAAERAIARLRQAKIPVRFRFVADESNLADLDRVLRFVEGHQLRRFDVMRAVPQRGRQEPPNAGTSPRRFREVLVHTRDTFARWRARGDPMRLSGHRAEHLWWLLEYEDGEHDGPPPGRRAIHSCSVARNLLALRPDGTVWPCRRLPLPLGLL
ncbi:MAG: hypothetical protein JRI68_28930, partial [Deltaproteobacteria bacterium]|nr:hypothetical protein [Deltaproteobacteria bacterium]